MYHTFHSLFPQLSQGKGWSPNLCKAILSTWSTLFLYSKCVLPLLLQQQRWAKAEQKSSSSCTRWTNTQSHNLLLIFELKSSRYLPVYFLSKVMEISSNFQPTRLLWIKHYIWNGKVSLGLTNRKLWMDHMRLWCSAPPAEGPRIIQKQHHLQSCGCSTDKHRNNLSIMKPSSS